MMDMGYEYSSTYWSGRVGTEYESNRSKNSTVMKPDWKDGSERRIDHGSCISRYSKYNLSSASLSLSTLTYYNVLGREREKVRDPPPARRWHGAPCPSCLCPSSCTIYLGLNRKFCEQAGLGGGIGRRSPHHCEKLRGR